MSGKHGKHRKRSRQVKKITALGAATVTATALTVGSTPLPNPTPNQELKKRSEADVALAAAINEWPSPGQLPDLTGGLGTAGYDLTQTFIEVVVRAVARTSTSRRSPRRPASTRKASSRDCWVISTSC